MSSSSKRVAQPDLFDDAPLETPAEETPRGFVRWPTMSYDPQKSRVVTRCLELKDWRRLNGLGAVWYDVYAECWFKFTPAFFTVTEVITSE